MEDSVHVKTKSIWKPVKFDKDFLSAKGFDGLISFEELTDYELVGTTKSKKRKKKQKTTDTIAVDQAGPISNDKTEEKQESKSKKKRKRKKKQKTTDTTAVDQAEPISNDKTEEKQESKSKKKRKRKKKKKATPQTENIEDLNATLEKESATEKPKSKKRKKKQKRKTDDADAPPKKKMKKTQKKDTEAVEQTTDETEALDGPITGMEGWNHLFVPDPVLRALKEQGFQEPTPIQIQVLPSAIRDRLDILGAAETGSGKTLAFGIPVLHYILEHKDREERKALMAKESEDEETEDSGVDIEPMGEKDSDADDDEQHDDDEQTAEDSDNDSDGNEHPCEDSAEDDSGDEQEVEEEADAADSDDNVEDEGEGEGDTIEQGDSEAEELEDLGESGIGCVKVVNDADFSWLEEAGDGKEGAVPKKPTRTHPRALILEPTRELAIQVKNHLNAAAKYTDIRIATIVGGMSVQKQTRVLKQCPDIIIATPGRLWELIQNGEAYLSEIEKTPHLVVDEADRMVEKGHFEELSKLLESMNSDAKQRAKRHTYVFSATLTLIHSGPQRTFKKKKKIKLDEKQKLEVLMESIGLKPKPKIVNLTRKVGTVETLTEARINCANDEKDIHLYYFLKQYPGRTLVFTNSKDCIRRLVSIFTLLQCNPLPLHADMHQRQRLKNLDKFTGNPRGFLLASDVAARGLDIPNVQHVIHYQVPYTVENYVHRSGRTARATKEGLSVVMVGPEDLKNYRKIIHTLNRDEDLPLFPIDTEYMQEVERRVKIVRQIETQEYRFNKSKRQNDWFVKAAEEIGVELDEHDRLLNDLGDDAEQNRHCRQLKQMKAELALILKQPILPGVAGSRYPTQSGQLVKLTRKAEEKNAILNVKKDRKSHQKMVKKEEKRPLPARVLKINYTSDISEEKNAILNVKKDRKSHQKMVEKEKKRPLPARILKKKDKKKDKWKKKYKRDLQQDEG